jgi:hypothetical protein
METSWNTKFSGAPAAEKARVRAGSEFYSAPHSRHTRAHLRMGPTKGPTLVYEYTMYVYQYEMRKQSERKRSVVAGGGCGRHPFPHDFSASPHMRHEEGDPNKRVGPPARSEAHSGPSQLPLRSPEAGQACRCRQGCSTVIVVGLAGQVVGRRSAWLSCAC